MGWLDALYGKDVCLDTAHIIYYIEKGLPDYKQVLDPFFTMIAEERCSALASVMSLLEGLVVPTRNNDKLLMRRYRNFFYGTRVQIVEITSEIAEKAAELKAAHNIKTPDAIQVATFLYLKADFFLTNDRKLASIPGINVLMLDNLKAQANSSESTTDS